MEKRHSQRRRPIPIGIGNGVKTVAAKTRRIENTERYEKTSSFSYDKIIAIEDDFRDKKIFEIINECFGKNYTGWMKAWFKIDDNYAAWFPRMEEAKIDSDSSNALAGNRFVNRISVNGTIIEEIDPTRKKSEDMLRDKFTDPARLVFGRMKDGFHFIGIFIIDELSKDGIDCVYHTYKRIGTKIDLSTMKYE